MSAGWILSDEEFLQGMEDIDLLKLRVSCGVTGNNNIGNYTFIPNTGSANYVFNKALASGVTITTLGNTELGWERNKQFDIGLDLAVLNNRITFTYDYYRRTSDGLIQEMPIPAHQASPPSSIT